ncbi:MAG: hypothetical protein ACOC1F_06920, partial [Myxococcota bacterium]
AQLPLADVAEVAIGVSPGVGVFTSRHHGKGHRFELRAFACIGEADGLAVRRYPGLFVGGAFETNHERDANGWEIVAGLESPVPVNWLLFGAEP